MQYLHQIYNIFKNCCSLILFNKYSSPTPLPFEAESTSLSFPHCGQWDVDKKSSWLLENQLQDLCRLDHTLEVPDLSAWILEEDKMCRRDPYSPERESLLTLRPGVRNQHWLFWATEVKVVWSKQQELIELHIPSLNRRANIIYLPGGRWA